MTDDELEALVRDLHRADDESVVAAARAVVGRMSMVAEAAAASLSVHVSHGKPGDQMPTTSGYDCRCRCSSMLEHWLPLLAHVRGHDPDDRGLVYLAWSAWHHRVRGRWPGTTREDGPTTGRERDDEILRLYVDHPPEVAAMAESARAGICSPAAIRRVRVLNDCHPETGVARVPRERRMAEISRLRSERYSARRIGEDLGLSHTTVLRYFAEIDARSSEAGSGA